MDLSLSWSSFYQCLEQIKSLSDELHDGWMFHGSANVENEAYLTRKMYKPISMLKKTSTTDVEQTITIDYHVTFSPTYSCPILCFNAWKNSGVLLSLEEWWDYLDVSTSPYQYSMLTQLDHPVLKKPFLTLHPCKTSELISSFSGSKNKVISWLSTVGPVVGLTILPEYAKLTF